MKTVYTSNLINRLAESENEFVRKCDESYRDSVKQCAEKIFDDADKKIIMLAGPSASGKTTTAKILSEVMEELGAKAYTVSLDDFYRSHDEEDYPLNEKGEQDYECVESLDIPLIKKCIRELIDDNESLLPEFDFSSGMRNDNAKKIVLGDNDIIIIEGLHALNPVITVGIDEKNIFKIFVSVGTRVFDENGGVLLARADLRFVRRAVRDYQSRNMNITRTLGIWESVRTGEKKYLFPFEKYADFEIDSFHPCEPCLLAQAAIELLSGQENGEYSEIAARCIASLSAFRRISPSIIADDSLMKEFLPNNKGV